MKSTMLIIIISGILLFVIIGGYIFIDQQNQPLSNDNGFAGEKSQNGQHSQFIMQSGASGGGASAGGSYHGL